MFFGDEIGSIEQEVSNMKFTLHLLWMATMDLSVSMGEVEEEVSPISLNYASKKGNLASWRNLETNRNSFKFWRNK